VGYDDESVIVNHEIQGMYEEGHFIPKFGGLDEYNGRQNGV